MQLWNWRKGEVVLQVFQKSFSRDEWPAIQITNDGHLACQAVNGAINCYSLTDPAAGEKSIQGTISKSCQDLLTLKADSGYLLAPMGLIELALDAAWRLERTIAVEH